MENKPKHTPGKTFELRIRLDVCKSWIDDGFDAHSAIEKIQTFFQEDLIPYAYNGEVTAMVTVKEKKTKANATLKAAGPELLEALQSCARLLHYTAHGDSWQVVQAEGLLSKIKKGIKS